MLFIHKLCFKTCVVSSGEPERRISLHPVVANHDVLDHIHRVAYMEIGIGVWGREENRERFFLRINFWREVSTLFPHLIDGFLNSFRIVRFVHARIVRLGRLLGQALGYACGSTVLR